MGLELPLSLDALFTLHRFFTCATCGSPKTEECACPDQTRRSVSVPPKPAVDVVVIDGDVMMKLLQFSVFVCDSGPRRMSGQATIAAIAGIIASRYLECKCVLLVFDTRVPGKISVPRQEVAEKRKSRSRPGTAEDDTDICTISDTFEFSDAASFFPLAADTNPRTRERFRKYVADGLYARYSSEGVQFAALLGTDVCTGTPELRKELVSALHYGEADMRISLCVKTLLRHGSSLFLVWSNDTDTLFTGVLCRNPACKIWWLRDTKKPIIRLDRLYARCPYANYETMLWWWYLNGKADYTAPPLRTVTAELHVTMEKYVELTSDGLVVYRRALASHLATFPLAKLPEVIQSVTQLVYSMLLYLLMKPCATDFGWTNTPGERQPVYTVVDEDLARAPPFTISTQSTRVFYPAPTSDMLHV